MATFTAIDSGAVMHVEHSSSGVSLTLSDSAHQAPNEDEALKEVVEMAFSGDEVGGRYLDVHEHFHQYVNAKFGKQLDYLEYLTSFWEVSDISRQHRLSESYRQAAAFLWLAHHA